MDNTDESSRRCVLRAYGAISLAQLFLGLLLIVSGIMAIKYSVVDIELDKPPYFIGAFFVGLLITCAGICSLYVFITEAPLIDYYFLEPPAANKIRRAVTGNTVSSILSFIGCILGLFVCIFYAVGPCETNLFPTECSFKENKVENRTVSIFITVFLCSSMALSVYSSLMSCIHGWVFDFDACTVTVRHNKDCDKDKQDGGRPVSGFQQVPTFDIDENNRNDEVNVANNYNATSSFRKPHEDHYGPSDTSFEDEGYQATRKQHIQATQPQCYVAVLNDPAMKQKLKERVNRLEDQEY